MASPHEPIGRIARLEAIEHAGLFLEALEGPGGWYRYHALFAAAMRHEAGRRLGEEALRELSLQASAWYEQEALFTEAIEAAYLAQDMERVARLIERVHEQNFSEPQTMLRWLEQLLEAVLREHPMLCFLFATNGEPEKALQHLPEALRLKPTLFEVSKRDSDLDSLRANPAFQAILTDRALLAHVPVSDLISPQDLHEIIRGAASPLVIDVRGSTEYAVGHVAGAVNIPLGNLESQLLQIPQDRPVVTYCNMHNRGGSRGEQAAVLLRNQGYQVRTLDGGYPAWQEQGFRVETVVQV